MYIYTRIGREFFGGHDSKWRACCDGFWVNSWLTWDRIMTCGSWRASPRTDSSAPRAQPPLTPSTPSPLAPSLARHPSLAYPLFSTLLSVPRLARKSGRNSCKRVSTATRRRRHRHCHCHCHCRFPFELFPPSDLYLFRASTARLVTTFSTFADLTRIFAFSRGGYRFSSRKKEEEERRNEGGSIITLERVYRAVSIILLACLLTYFIPVIVHRCVRWLFEKERRKGSASSPIPPTEYHR